MKNKTLFKTIVKITLISLVLAMSMFQFQVLPAQAGALTNISDTMSRLKTGVGANHEINFTLSSDTAGPKSETITITFNTWANGLNGIDCGDVDILDDGTDEDLQNEAGNCAADADEWGAVVAGDVLTLTAPSTSDTTYIDGNSVVTVQIGTNADTEGPGDEQITNPAAANDLDIDIGGTFGDTGTLAVSIVTDDQVVVTATVDPTFTFAIYKPGTTTPTTYCWRDASNTGLGSISGGSATVDTCKYDVYTATNATEGYVTTINSVSDGNNAAFNDDATGNYWFNQILPITDGDVDASQTDNYSEYGASTSDSDATGLPVTNDNLGNGDCADDIYTWVSATNLYDYSSGLPMWSPLEAAKSTAPGSETATICHAAAVGPQFRAGSYTHTVILISTGTF